MTEPPRFRKSDLPTPYEVGYGKPPVSTRFGKGQSGNPKGRPKGARNRLPAMHEERLKDIVLAEAYRDIKVNDGDRQVTIPMAQALVRSMAVKAAKGDHRSQKLFAEMLNRTEQSRKASYSEWVQSAINYKVEWEQELDRRRKLGLDLPDLIPHPDDIEIEMKTGEVVIKGPFTREEHASWTMLAKRRDAAETELAELRRDLAAETDKAMRTCLEEQIAFEIQLRDRIMSAIGIWPNRDPFALALHKRRTRRRLEPPARDGRKKKAPSG